MEPPTQRTPPIDSQLLDVLADSERRHALCVLSAADEPVALNALALEVAARELGTPIPQVGPGQAKAREIALYHKHLPRMADSEIVEFDARQRTVELRESEQLAGLLDTLPRFEPPGLPG